MRVLVTCDRYPASLQDGLVLRLRHLLAQLQDRHEFDLVCLDRDQSQPCAELDRLFGTLRRVPHGPRVARTGWARAKALFDETAAYPRSEAAATAISELLAIHPYDLIWDAGANMLNQLTGPLKGTGPPVLADQVDDAFVRMRREWQLAGTLRQHLALGQQWLAERRFAQRHLSRTATVLFASADDEASFRRLCPGTRTAAIANGVDAGHFARSADLPPAESQTLVFEGAMSYEPNVDAVLYFRREIWPLVREKQPGLRWLVVGREPSRAVRDLAGAGIEVSGSVTDVRPWLSRASVFVCPMRAGAGIKNKILQAWSMGLPVVSTTAGAQGLDAVNGLNILVADTPHAFARAVLKLLSDPQLARHMGQAGRSTVLRTYTWQRKAQELVDLFVALQQRRP
jgi:glycosyltransferase involved in cell wall biosynthesis